jgi:hypothetical protein
LLGSFSTFRCWAALTAPLSRPPTIHRSPTRRAGAPQNFVINAAQAQLNNSLVNPDGTPTAAAEVLARGDISLTAIFTAELLVNMYAHWFKTFFSNTSNLIDLAVVALSLASLGPLSMPISVLRMARAVRVVRLFSRLRAFKNIVSALTGSIVPVLNAFVLLMIVVTVCQLPPPQRPMRQLRRA